jgi:hypothetical protein
VRHMLGLDIPNFLPDVSFFRPAGRLIWTTVLFVVMMAPVMLAVKRPKSKLPTTWAQAMAGAVYVFALMVLAYGSIPHEWLAFANGHLKWDESHFILTSGQKIGPVRWLNFDVDKRALADSVASLIYIVFLGGNIALFAKWQKRPAAPADDATTIADEETVVGTSAFGRPVTAKA